MREEIFLTKVVYQATKKKEQQENLNPERMWKFDKDS